MVDLIQAWIQSGKSVLDSAEEEVSIAARATFNWWTFLFTKKVSLGFNNLQLTVPLFPIVVCILLKPFIYITTSETFTMLYYAASCKCAAVMV